MFKFANNPDKIFTKVLELMFQYSIERVGDCEDSYELECFLPHASRNLSKEIIRDLLSQFIQCNRDDSLWELNDYHFCLIYDLLKDFSDVQNGLARESNEPILVIDSCKIFELDFDVLVDHYFFDEDFLTEKEIFLSMNCDMKRQMGYSSETCGVIMGLKPHPDELKIKLYKKNQFFPEWPLSEFYKYGSRIYPNQS